MIGLTVKNRYLATALLALVATGCRTTDDSSEVQNFNQNPGAPGAAVKTIFADFAGDDAKSVYDAMTTLGKRVDTFTSNKIEQGNMRINCDHSGIPPGAQGMPGPTRYSCSAVLVPSGGQFPPGAQGMPPPAMKPFFQSVNGDQARALGMNLQNADYKWNGSRYAVSLFIKDATFSCSSKSAVSNGNVQETHGCMIDGNADTDTQPTETVYGDFAGNDAKLVFAAMKTAGKRVDTFATSKMEQGNIRISCERTGIPPGAMGLPGPTTYWCTAGVIAGTANFPAGAQGMPSPAIPAFFVGNKTQGAAALGKNLMNANYTYDSTKRRYVSSLDLKNGSFICTSKSTGPNAKNEYGCRITDSN